MPRIKPPIPVVNATPDPIFVHAFGVLEPHQEPVEVQPTRPVLFLLDVGALRRVDGAAATSGAAPLATDETNPDPQTEA
jgi:hypothetical protein